MGIQKNRVTGTCQLEGRKSSVHHTPSLICLPYPPNLLFLLFSHTLCFFLSVKHSVLPQLAHSVQQRSYPNHNRTHSLEASRPPGNAPAWRKLLTGIEPLNQHIWHGLFLPKEYRICLEYKWPDWTILVQHQLLEQLCRQSANHELAQS